VLLAASLVSFGKSFRVGIDIDYPDKLVTSGVFAITRNPICVRGTRAQRRLSKLARRPFWSAAKAAGQLFDMR
jgi:hypothetical protein